MAKTSAERSAEYRQRHLRDEAGSKERLNLVISLRAKRALERLVTHYGETQTALLERLIEEEQTRATKEMTNHQQEAYFDSSAKNH